MKKTMTASGERLLTVAEVAARLHLSARSCYVGYRQKMPWLKLPGGSLRMRPSDLEAWLDGHRQAA